MARHSPVEVLTGAAVLVVAAGFVVLAFTSTGQGSSHNGYLLHAAFDHVDGLNTGADVRIAGVKIGSVQSITLNPKTYEADVSFTVQNDVSLTTDSSAQISTDGLLGGKFMALTTGGDDKTLKDGGVITITQGSVNIEGLISKYIFPSVGSGKGSTSSSSAPGASNPPAAAPADKSVMPPLK